MTDKKISELAAASALAGTEVFPLVQSSATKAATINQVVAAAVTAAGASTTGTGYVHVTSGTKDGAAKTPAQVRADILPQFSLDGVFAGTIANGTTTIVLYASAAFTINALRTQLSAGTATVSLKINGTAVTGASCSATTSIVTGTATAANVVAAGDKITITIASAASSPADLAWSMIGTLS